MNTMTRHRRHPEDGELLRLIDRELSPDRAADVRAHLDACDRCAARHRQIRRRSDRLGDLLDRSTKAIDPPPVPQSTTLAQTAIPPDPSRSIARRGRAVWLRAAAIGGLVVGAAALAPPVRAWVATGVEAIAARLGAEADSRVDASADPATAAAPRTVVRFTTDGPILAVRVDDFGPGATLEVRRASGSKVVFSIGTGAASPLVLPGELRLDGVAAGARLVLEVPAGVRAIDLRIDGEERRLVPAESPDSAATIVPLQRVEMRGPGSS